MGPNNNNQQNRQGQGGNRGFSGRGGFGRGGNDPSYVKEFDETVVQINRISKKTKGGNQMRFSALVVVGDKKGKVGVGISKAKDVRNAIRKAIEAAKRRMIKVALVGTTIPYSVQEKFSAAKVLLKPAPPGSGIIAGGPMRVVLEASGIRDAVGKILGTKNKISNVYATLKALESISEMVKMREKESPKEVEVVKEVKTKEVKA